MKFRAGFVSNSSSSSYIVYGFLEDELSEDDKKKVAFHKFDWENGGLTEYVHGSDGDILGEVLASWGEEDTEVLEIDTSPSNLKNIRENVKEAFKKCGVILSDDIFKILATTYYS